MVSLLMFQHTAARRRLVIWPVALLTRLSFQHTAARRRLACISLEVGVFISFNTQPPEGGWGRNPLCSHSVTVFQHTAARRRLGRQGLTKRQTLRFQHTAARRRLENFRR